MKCDIIRDLLPSYMDGLSSSESTNAVELHLQQCDDCKKYYEAMKYDIPKILDVDEKLLLENMKGKNLLTRSKEFIQSIQAKTIVKVINMIAIILNILFILCGAAFMFSIKRKYPHLTLNSQYFILILLTILPIIIGITQLCFLKKIKHYIFRILSSIFMQCFFLFWGGLSAIGLFILLPPLESKTNNTEHYLVVDDETERFSPVYNAIFPNTIPNQAADIQYCYLRKEALFSEEITITASWTLPEKDYIDAKNNILDNHYVEEISDNNWKITAMGIRYPEKADLNLEFDDNSRIVKYIFNVDRNH